MKWKGVFLWGLILLGLLPLVFKAMPKEVSTPLANAHVSVGHMYHKGRPLIWKQNQLKIYNSKPNYQNLIQHTFDVWQVALAPVHTLTLTWVSTPEEADIVIRFVDEVPLPVQKDALNRRGYIAGLSTPIQYDSAHNQLDTVHIQFSLLNSAGVPQSLNVLTRVMLHEWGHALGLWGHSSNTYDVMAAHYYKQIQTETEQLNQGDIKTLQTLYRQDTPTTSHDYTLAVLKRESERNPSQINYWKYARALRDASHTQEAFVYYQKAVALEARNADLYLEYVQTVQKTGDNITALRLLSKDLPPALADNARLTLEKAWVQLKLNQANDAKMSQAQAIKRDASLEASLLNQALTRYLYHLND
jgi:predicted Zn-dependent protease